MNNSKKSEKMLSMYINSGGKSVSYDELKKQVYKERIDSFFEEHKGYKMIFIPFSLIKRFFL